MEFLPVGTEVKVKPVVAWAPNTPGTHGATEGRIYKIAIVQPESCEGNYPENYQVYKLDGAGWVTQDEVEVV